MISPSLSIADGSLKNFIYVLTTLGISIVMVCTGASAYSSTAWITASVSDSIIPMGEEVEIVAHAGGGTPPDLVAFWIFSHDYFFYGTTGINPDGSYRVYLYPSQTSAMPAGQYFVVLQLPGSDGEFDVYAEENVPRSGSTGLASSIDDTVYVIQGTGAPAKTVSAGHLIELLDDTRNDDTYSKLSFLITYTDPPAEPWIIIDEFGGDQYLGSTLVLQGDTDVPAGTLLDLTVQSVSFSPGGPAPALITGIAEVGSGPRVNHWSVSFDTGSLRPDEYLILVQDPESDGYAAQYFNLIYPGQTVPSTTSQTLVQYGTTPPPTSGIPGKYDPSALVWTGVRPGDRIPVHVNFPESYPDEFLVIHSTLMPDEGEGWEIVVNRDRYGMVDPATGLWRVIGFAFEYEIVVPSGVSGTYTFTPRYRQVTSTDFVPLDTRTIVIGGLPAASPDNQLGDSIRAATETTGINPIASMLPAEACPVCAVAAGAGIAVLGAATAAGGGGSSAIGSQFASRAGEFGWLSTRLGAFAETIAKMIGFRMIGVAGAHEAKIREFRLSMDETYLFGLSKRELIVLGASLIIFSMAFAIAGRLEIDPAHLLMFLAMGGIAVIGHELITDLAARRLCCPSEYQLWGLGTLILLFNSGIFGMVFGKPSRTVLEGNPDLPVFQKALLLLIGPVFNIVMAGFALLLIPLGGIAGLAGLIGFPINLLLAVYSLVPVWPLKGKALYDLEKALWAVFFIPLIIFYLYAYLIA